MNDNGPQLLQGSVYDYPGYYDLVYGSDWQAELVFLHGAFAKYGSSKSKSKAEKVRTVFEPACGTGRLLYRLAREGFQVSGLDLNSQAVNYCNDRLARCGFPRSVIVGNMADFRVQRQFDAAFNMINSFRHLMTEQEAKGHFHCMARLVKKGGLYILGLHLTPTRGQPGNAELWSARRGHLAVTADLRTVQRDTRRRVERCAMTYNVYTPTRHLRLQDEVCFRTYTKTQFRRLLQRTGHWEIVATFDFAYDLDLPIQVDATTEDVVFVLRRSS